ncbi:MAG TPA: M23 family metallopeptidase [Myxococcales bacterium]|nr:M23 family metallopeptidase [Myxococcales bacterium]
MADDLFGWGLDFEFQNAGQKDARVWAHPKCKGRGPRPLLIWLHGTNRPDKKHPPQLTERLDRDLCAHVGKLAQFHINAGHTTPLIIAAPSCVDDGSSTTLWSKFDLDGFVDKVIAQLPEDVKVDPARISVIGHSGAGCDVRNGLAAIATAGGKVKGKPLEVLGYADTCYTLKYAKGADEGLTKAGNTETTVYCIFKDGGGGGGSYANAADFAKALNAGKWAGAGFESPLDVAYGSGKRLFIHLTHEQVFADEATWLKGALKKPFDHDKDSYGPHYGVCLVWTSWALRRFFKPTEKAEAAPPPGVTGGEWADVPTGPDPWNPPDGAEPHLTGDAEFADPGSGRFWPVRTQNQFGRTVCFLDAGSPVGVPGPDGPTTQERHFLAARAGANGARYHAGIDLFGDFHDLVVATESATILSFEPFYQNLFKLFLKCDSGLVINYGDVDERSLKEFNLELGNRVQAGQPIARVGRMAGGCSMLHFETYPAGTSDVVRYFASDPPSTLMRLLNPTQYLLALARLGR